MRGGHIINYIRKNQSAQALRLALCEVAKLAILPADDVLRNIYVSNNKHVYTFNNYTVSVKYTHEPLVLNTAYPKNTVIGGEYIKVYSQQATSNEQWWRALDWEAGLPVTGVFAGLTIPDSLVRFYWVSDWVDSTGATRKHIQADFDPDHSALQTRFWQQIHDSEERTELTLADASELSAVEDGVDVTINMLDFYFRNLYGDRAIVVDLQTVNLGDSIHRNVQHFLRRETPVGSIIIQRLFGSEAFVV